MQLQQLRSSDLFPVRAFEVFCQLLTVLTAEPMHQFLVLRAIMLRIAKVTHTALFETFWDAVWLSDIFTKDFETETRKYKNKREFALSFKVSLLNKFIWATDLPINI